MFLMATRGTTPDQAIAFIKERREIAFQPSANFYQSMEGFYRAYQRDIVPRVANVSI
jgi:hypothetical protein